MTAKPKKPARRKNSPRSLLQVGNRIVDLELAYVRMGKRMDDLDFFRRAMDDFDLRFTGLQRQLMQLAETTADKMGELGKRLQAVEAQAGGEQSFNEGEKINMGPDGAETAQGRPGDPTLGARAEKAERALDAAQDSLARLLDAIEPIALHARRKTAKGHMFSRTTMNLVELFEQLTGKEEGWTDEPERPPAEPEDGA